MSKFKVTETVVYLIDADDEEEAIDILVHAEDTNEFFLEVIDRSAEQIDAD